MVIGNDGAAQETPLKTRNVIDRVPCPGPFFSRSSPEIVDCDKDDGKKKFVLESIEGYYCCTLLHKLQDWDKIQTSIAGRAEDDRMGLGTENGSGVAMSADGTRLAVGTRYNDNQGGKNAGMVRVYEETPFGWEPLGQPIPGHSDGELFGYSIAMSHNGKVVAVSSVRAHGSRGTYQGVVRVYMYDEDSFPPLWRQFGSELHGDDTLDYFGHSVSLCSEGNVVAIGAVQHFGIEDKKWTGYVKAFGWNGNRWNPMGEPLHGLVNGERFGSAVSLSASGKVMAVGANGGDTGTVSVYRFVEGNWLELGQSLVGLDDQERFGSSVSMAMNGKTVAIGAPHAGENSGAVRVYHLRDDEWFQVGEDIVLTSNTSSNNNNNSHQHKDEAVEDAEFGSSVSLSGDGGTVLVGAAHAHGPQSVFEGQVRAFRFQNERWELLGKPLSGSTASENFGVAVSLSKDGKRLAASAPYANTDSGKHAGEVRIYGLQ